MKYSFFILFQALVLAFFPACSSTVEGGLQQLLGTRAEAPVFLDCRAVSPTEVVFSFSHPVRVRALYFDKPVETESIEEGIEVRVTFMEGIEAGIKVTADILVEDYGKNTLNVIVPFRTRNDRMPSLIFNEIRTEYSNPNVEFLEFIALEAGNLGAMRLFISCQSLTVPVYEFPPAEVKAGEYIVLHLRTREEACLDETGEDLSLSGGNGSHINARDLWVPGAQKMLHKTEAVWLLDQDDRIIDAVLLCETPDAGWNARNSAEAAEYLGRENAWLVSGGANGKPGPEDAIDTRGTTATRTICRDQSLPHANAAANWYITATSSATPGTENSTKRYN